MFTNKNGKIWQTKKTRRKVFNIDEFLAEIGCEPLLSIDEELALSKAIQKKGPECDEMQKLIEPNMRFVVSVANQYQNQGLSLEELIEAGKHGLEKAAMKYDFKYDFKFISYAVWWIRQAIIQTIEEKKYVKKEPVVESSE